MPNMEWMGMMVQPTPKISLLHEHKFRQFWDTIEEQVYRAKTQEVWKKKRENAYKPVTTRTAHQCEACNHTIPPKTKAYKKSWFGNIATGSGITMGFRTDYYHEECKPKEEP